MYVYRRPHDFRAARFDQRIVFGTLYADVPVSVYRLPPKLIRSDGLYRQSYTVLPGATFYPTNPQGTGGSSSLTFTCSATPQAIFDSASSLIIYFERVRKERAAWSRPPESWDAIRSLSPQFTSWQPTGATSLVFSVTGTAIGALFGAGSTSLSFSATGVLSSTGVLRGATTLSFAATAVTGGETLIAGATTLSFSAVGQLASGLIGSTSITFTPSAAITGLAAIQGATGLSFAVGPAALVVYTPADVLVRATRRGWFGGRWREAGTTFYLTTPYEYSPYWMAVMSGLPDDWPPFMRNFNAAVNREILRPTTPAEVAHWLETGIEPPEDLS